MVHDRSKQWPFDAASWTKELFKTAPAKKRSVVPACLIFSCRLRQSLIGSSLASIVGNHWLYVHPALNPRAAVRGIQV